MHTEIAIDIDASPELVFALAHDVERWSDLLPHYVRSRARDHDAWGRPLVDFIARRPLVATLGLGLPVAWRSRTWNEPETLRLRFEHVAGATRGMSVVWDIDTRGGGDACRVTIRHEFSPRVPGFARFVDRFFTRPIAGRTLATFKTLAEAVDSVDGSDPTSPTHRTA
ncbi:MAG TPA: SRPBCC family protein [Candidatus Limnocylindrales bacterium]|nr:SRPBCC family protein [Candidatus Limnocylindrales bacterium]